MTQTTTTDQPTDTQRLAMAIMQVTEGLQFKGIYSQGFLEARDLVRDLAFPDHVDEPRPDPAPSCDSPHCDCVEGGDCRANVAGGTYEDGEGRIRQLTETQPSAGEDCKASGAAEPDWSQKPGEDGARTAYIKAGDVSVELLRVPKVRAKCPFGTPVVTGVNDDEVAYVLTGTTVTLRDGPRAELTMVRYLAKGETYRWGPQKDSDLRPFDVSPDAVNVLAPGMKVETNPSTPTSPRASTGSRPRSTPWPSAWTGRRGCGERGCATCIQPRSYPSPDRASSGSSARRSRHTPACSRSATA